MIFSYKKIKTINHSLPQKDEMTRKRSQKAAAYSFYVIIVIFIVLLGFPEEPIISFEMLKKWGAGTMMAIYGISWLVIDFRGIKDE
jgi:undecaprenyl pyrophosphate phosphatase UppP